MNVKNLDFKLDELKILAENGQKDLEHAVGYYYEFGVKDAPLDYAQAAKWYKKAADKGHAESMVHLGYLYATGKGVEQNQRTAFAYIKRAADTGNMNAQYNLARCFEEGIGTLPNRSKAFDWYKKAADQNDFRAKCCVAGYLVEGTVVPQDLEQAFKLFKQAAFANLPPAQYNLSLLYRYGEGTEKNEEKANEWLTKAAQNGFSLAKRDLFGKDTEE